MFSRIYAKIKSSRIKSVLQYTIKDNNSYFITINFEASSKYVIVIPQWQQSQNLAKSYILTLPHPRGVWGLSNP